jgi:O-antigen ligase
MMHPSIKYPLLKELPTTVLVFLPFTLFFPVGIMYAVLGVFIFVLILSGDYELKISNVRNSLLFFPALALLVLSILSSLFISSSDYHPFKHLLHYQIYFVLLMLISVGGGEWQKKAMDVFLVGAVYGSSLFFLTRIFDFPNWIIFRNYISYEGNKSVSLGIFLGIAAAVSLLYSLHENNKNKKIIYGLIYIYISVAVLFFAKTRSGHVALISLSLLAIAMNFKFRRSSFILPIVLAILLAGSWQSSTLFKDRTTRLVNDLIVFSKGGTPSFEAARLEFFVHTGEIISEKPIIGHGVGAWRAQYPDRARGLITSEMSAPHNDYLLYWAELGIPGLMALGWIWFTLIRAGRSLHDLQGQILITLTVATIVGGLTNTILRDWRFGVPIMILTSAVLAGMAKKNDDQASMFSFIKS